MKTILIAIPTNKYITPETMKSIYDLEVPEGYKTEFQYFFGYSRSQIKNLICEWSKSFTYTLIIKEDVVVPKNLISQIIKEEAHVVSINDTDILCVKGEIFLRDIQYPYFVSGDTRLFENQQFISKISNSGLKFKHLVL